jgi:4-hydroxy-tetrahydrodipicolinate reductase
VLGPALERAGHELVDLDNAEAVVDFTAPEAVEDNVRAGLERGISAVVGTTGWETERLGEEAKKRDVALFYAPNFAIGAVLMMRLAEEAARYLPRAEIVELHAETKKDAPSGTAKATAERVGGAEIHSVRLPGLVAHQEVLFGGDGQLLTIRHDAYSREAYVPGVLLALERLSSLPPGLTVGLEALLD